jgi:F-type H+-transporting ATPase subunit b
MIALAAAAADVNGQLGDIATTFGVDWPHLTAQTISFSVVCALLYWLAYRPVLRVLDARRRQIAQGLARTDEIAREVARASATRRHVLKEAHAEAAHIVEDARTAAKRVHAVELTRATAMAQRIVAQAHKDAEHDRARLHRELRHEVGRLVVRTTAAVAGKVLTVDDERRLLEETTRQLAS